MGGGLNAGFGGLNEHLDENALQQAMGQKQLGQQATSQQQSVNAGQGGQKALTDLSKLQAMDGMQPDALQQAGGARKARAVGTLPEELVFNPIKDVVAGLKSIFDINALLGINPATDSPEEKAKKQKMHQRWQKLTQEEQQVAQQRYQEEMQRKQTEEEEKMLKQQQAEDARANAIQAPSSPQKGPKGPGGSKKQKAVTKMQNDRKQLGGAKNKH